MIRGALAIMLPFFLPKGQMGDIGEKGDLGPFGFKGLKGQRGPKGKLVNVIII